MNFQSGSSTSPILIVHGGAGPQDPKTVKFIWSATEDLCAIGTKAYALLEEGIAPTRAVLYALQLLEDDPQFNAGIGSALQADGQARLTASLMDGQKQSFSGVIGVQNVRNPSRLAEHLQSHDSRVLANPGAELLARELLLPVANVITTRRLERWLKTHPEVREYCDTVGCVVWNGTDLAAGTSTGGRGHETPGRVSDSATVAGNYASKIAAVSATGIGEEIVDDALAARIETRARDGMTLSQACEKTFEEAKKLARSYGFIACDNRGNWVVAHTTPAMTYAVIGEGGEILCSSHQRD